MSGLALLSSLSCAPAALGLLHKLAPGSGAARPLFWGAIAASLCLGAWKLSPRAEHARTPSAAAGVEVEPTARGYVGSGACQSCHPGEYASWHRSYHRSMTELPSRESMRAPWQDERLDLDDRSYHLYRRGNQYWVAMPDPDQLALSARRGGLTEPIPRVERQILMTTGSHHYQGYWVAGRRGNELWQLPFVYQFESARFLPRASVFLQPPDDPAVVARWNSSCVQCHAVAGEPRHDLELDRFATRAAELGIACEACHGPGREHVAREHNPLTRYRTRSGDAEPSIVNPAHLPAQRASEVCGQCHAYFVPKHPDDWWQSGYAANYTPGAALDDSRHLLDFERDEPAAEALVGDDLRSLFYADGSVRVGGREWNGLEHSACFQRGQGTRQISCSSCHQLHGGTHASQLSEAALGNAACGACHSELAAAVAAHSHHPAASEGSACVNCHMPFTSYALLGSVRSHRITKPSAPADSEGLAPNACNLCHLDRGLAWTRQWLARWYGDVGSAAPTKPAAAQSSDEQPLAIQLLTGDAATRVVVAAALGWPPARAASSNPGHAELLAEALDDPYAAVRFVAYRSLRTEPAFADFSYDFIADASVRRERQERAREIAAASWRAAENSSAPGRRLPHDGRGELDRAFVERLIAGRDQRPVRIAE
ncbi:MAG TPA: cytochrome c3 family protein [Polyangiaceae bacterium]|nr:cytochrome c3 family protein [Polyangiaceae bacterium]